MNAGLNLNNMITSSVSSNLTQVSKDAAMNKGTFLKMVGVLINKSQVQQQASANSVSSLFDSLIGKSLSHTEDLNNLFPESNEESIDLSEVKKNKNYNYEAAIENPMFMMNHLTQNSEMKINEQPMKDSFLTIEKNKTSNSEHMYEKLESTQISNEKPSETSIKTNFQIERFISEIEKLKTEKYGSGINLDAHISREPLIHEHNKIITVADESSQIKSQVLSQLKDKIEFIVDEGMETQGIKHVKMQLQPHRLGKVDIKMTYEHDKLTVEIKALNEETQKMLSLSADELTNLLRKTTESSVKVIVKSFHEFEPHQLVHQNSQSRHYENFEQQDGNRRQKHYYYYENSAKDNDEEGLFSELINLKNIKLS